MRNLSILIVFAVLISVSGSTSYVLAESFSVLEVTGTSTFFNDLIFDRTDNANSIVQGTDAFNAGRDLIYQKQGGGDMSGYQVKADKIILSGGPVAIGTESPDFTVALDYMYRQLPIDSKFKEKNSSHLNNQCQSRIL
jgi:hypothetical protein